ncbi:phytanoyl-CoA dioxygenase family protein [Alphaproteobacteria bacterium]|nr:phytanoyl-CoA dioxygenase family protein [Alphaproteobacteria bacterium]
MSDANSHGSVTKSPISQSQIEAFERDGAVILPGLFADWVDEIAAAIAHNIENPGPYAAENLQDGDTGRFFDDYCNWQNIPELTSIMRHSPASAAAAGLMQSNGVQFFHDHILVKEPGTSKATPWHQDAPYYFVDGMQSVSFWIPIDPVDDATLRLIAGSHKWDKMVLPTRWLAQDDFYPSGEDFLPVPDPDATPDDYEILEWPMQPGDAVAFHYRTVHGARGNMAPSRRRALSLRYVGDDARYITRPGPTSPPFPGHDMQDGDRLRSDWFPQTWPPRT